MHTIWVLTPEHGNQAYFYLAKAYGLSGEYKKAVSAYNKVIELALDSFLAGEAEKGTKKISNLL